MKQTSYHLRGIQWTCCHICKACTLPIIWQSCQPLLSSAGTIRPTKQLDMANESAHQPSLEPGGERNALTALQSPSVEKNWSALMISLVLKALLAVIMVSKPEVLLSWLCNIWKSSAIQPQNWDQRSRGTLTKELEELGLTSGEAQAKALGRVEWHNFITALCPSQD